ncbi:MAG TPA: FGGY-family carbohydrate kinase [Candidatus Dormibacteraeota bacterium]|nr:FGGY-family carbohydrate kinase [Candidatus Dormibacteraeota bacterium]
MTTPVLVGIDLGTTRVKAGLLTLDGAPVGLGRAAYGMDVDPASGRAEQDPEAWWAGLGEAVRMAIEQAHERGFDTIDPVGVCIAGHGPTLTAVDAEGRAVRPAITWLDSRSGNERAALEAATGLRGWALGVLPAARWLERHDPATAARARWYLNSWEALGLRLTGRAATSVVPGGEGISRGALAGAGLDLDRVAADARVGTVLGGLLPEPARLLGLPAGTPVVVGLVDAFASFHGARMLEPGDAIDVGGAAGGFGVYADGPIEVAGGFTTPAPLPGLYSVGGAMAATGAALDWLGSEILNGSVPVDDLLAAARTVAPGAEGLVFLPYLAGERSPLWDASARGVFAGLTLRHTRAHLVRATLEAAALAIRHVAAPMLAAGIEVTAMRACGGPARDDGWNQIKADVTGFTVEVPRLRETAAAGAAIVAAVGMGVHPDLPAAIREMTTIDRRFEPDPERGDVYDELYAAYTALHPAVSPILRGLAAGRMPAGPAANLAGASA